MAEGAQRVRAIIDAATRPVVPPHIKLRHDAGRGRWIILAPERLFDPDKVAALVKKLVEEFDMEEEEAVQIINAMPQSIQEIRVFLAGGRKIIETSKLEKILFFLKKYRKKE